MRLLNSQIMRISLGCTFYCLLMISCVGQQDIDTYLGGWSGDLEEVNAFKFRVNLLLDEEGIPSVSFIGNSGSTTLPIVAVNEQYWRANHEQLSFHLLFEHDTPLAFVETGNHQTFLSFKKEDKMQWSTDWNLFIDENPDPTLYLSLDRLGDQAYAASTFFQSPVLYYMFGQDFQRSGKTFQFYDARSGLRIGGTLGDEEIRLKLQFLSEQTTVALRPTDYAEWRVGERDIETEKAKQSIVANAAFAHLEAAILSDTLINTHSIIISQADEIIYEQYFDGFGPHTTHDTRSLSKSFAAALTGIAIGEGRLKNEYLTVASILSRKYPDIDWSNGKDSINLFHLLTMSTGLDAIDFGLNRMSFANEGNYQQQEDWTEFILRAPMVYPVGKLANYGSGSAHLLAPIISSTIDNELQFYIHQKLMAPLEITNYRLQVDNKGVPYFGGGWYMTASDLLKFAQLFLHNGKHHGVQVVPADWIEKSTQRHKILANTFDQNPYGFLLWHRDYEIDGQRIASVEGRGTGGQYFFIVPAYDLTVVILSGNFRNNRGFQPERIMESFILPTIIEK